MKEAISELNLTVIIVLAVAGLVALFSVVIWPAIKTGIQDSANCSDAICTSCNESTGVCECYMESNPGNTFDCAYKG
ncbi:MAG: hypothetical protein IJA94_03760 [Bacilli bacterium]|nr:hypothetical protein [Bacilli bacterium]